MAIKKKSGQSTFVKVGTVIICVIVVLALMVPVAGIGLSSCGNSQQNQQAKDGGAASNTGAASSEGDASTSSDDKSVEGELDLRNMYQASIQKYQKAIASDPENYSNYEMLGNVAFDWAKSVQQGSLSANPFSIAELYQMSIAAYTSRLEIKPSTEVYVDRAIATYYSGDTASAIQQLETYTTEDPYFAKAWANLGIFYATDGQTDKARESFEKGLEASPDSDTRAFIEESLESLEKN